MTTCNTPVQATATNDAHDTTVALKAALARSPMGHPRLWIAAADLAALPNRTREDPTLAAIAREVVAKADAALTAAPPTRVLEGRRMLHVSREVLASTLALSTAYHLSGDMRYARRATADLLAVSAFEDWNPAHFLDVGEMTLAVAIGYDWLHAQLSETERAILRRAILEKGFAPSWTEPKPHWWVHAENNWNQVCHAGLSAGAIALLDEEPAAAQRILARAIESVPIAMRASYAPDGAYPEGAIYWDYGTSFNVILIAMLERVYANAFGLTDAPGFMDSAAYMNQVTGPGGSLNCYADSRAEARLVPLPLFWFAQRLNRPELVAFHRPILTATLADTVRDQRLSPLLLFWYTPPAAQAADCPQLPLDWHGRGIKPVAMHRSDWSPRAIYASILGGSPGSNHAHMDIGAFLFEADGVRWAHDLGMQNYGRVEALGLNLWDRSQDSDRWRLFRYGTSGHNTLMIDGANQRVDGHAPLLASSADAQEPFSVVDMTSLYAGQATSVIRGIRLPSRQHLVVVDELRGVAPGAAIRWAMNTRAAVRVGTNGVASLTQDGQTLTIHLLEPANTNWQVLDVSTPRQTFDEANPGMSQLACTVHASERGNPRLVVLLQTGRGNAPTSAEIAAWGPPSAWH